VIINSGGAVRTRSPALVLIDMLTLWCVAYNCSSKASRYSVFLSVHFAFYVYERVGSSWNK
jgi:hypothetical protein